MEDLVTPPDQQPAETEIAPDHQPAETEIAPDRQSAETEIAPDHQPAETEITMEELLASNPPAEEPAPASMEDTQLRAVLEAIIYVAEEPLTLAQLAAALQHPVERVRELM